VGNTLIVIGIVIVIVGIISSFLPKGGLPGDILVKKDNFTFAFPIVSSIVISIILTILFNLFGRK